MADTTQNRFKVRLKSRGAEVAFDVTPDVTENVNVNYKTLDPLHMPGGIHVYANTSSRVFNLSNVKLVSRTPEEASKNMSRLWMLKGWCRPRFGEASRTLNKEQRNNRLSNQRGDRVTLDGRERDVNTLTPEERRRAFGQELLGAPPEVLRFYAYSDTTTATRKSPTNIHNIPVVIEQLSIPYMGDVDYIETLEGSPFPILMTIDMQLRETHAPKEYSNFSLDAFRKGMLDTF